VKNEQFKVLAGQAKEHTEKHENGMNLHTFFCDNCISTIWRTADGSPAADQFKGQVAVFIGTLDDMEELDRLKPDKEVWTKRRTAWRGEVSGAVQVDGLWW
jgi:hypothetical protein